MIGNPELFETYEAACTKCNELIGWNCPAVSLAVSGISRPGC